MNTIINPIKLTLMKTTKFLLLLILSLCTFNVWAQSEKPESFNLVSESTTPVDLNICLASGVDGILYMYVDNQSLYHGYWGDGYMLISSIHHVDFKPQINVYPGDIIRVYASLHSINGNSGVVNVEVPDNATSTLYVTINMNSNYKISASF